MNTHRRDLLACAIAAVLAAPAGAQNDTEDAPKPLAVWRFDGEAAPGPRPPEYPSFAADNRAREFTASRPSVTVREPDRPGVNLRFAQGDSITLEAWVKVAELKDGAYAYLVGKGRSRRAGFPEKNQNYALRLKGDKGQAKVSFLFASAAAPGRPSDWHRWTTRTGFALSGWHHVAVSYTFGKPKSVRAVIDGQAVPGVWDMGGATERPPVTDADDLALGTGNGGGAGNSFRGWLDDVTVWRAALPEETLTARYQFVPPPPVIVRASLPRGKVLVQLCDEGLPARNAWPETTPRSTDTYEEEAFGFFDVPQRYVDTGVRGDRPNPYLFRAAALVKLPAGKHRFLLRARGAARLYFDDKLLLTTPFPPQDSSGHGTVRKPESYLDLGPDFRFAPPGNRESWTTFTSSGAEHVVVLETIVGGYIGRAKRRPELGETVVAWSRQDSDSWELLAPGKRVVPYTDAGWAGYEAERAAHIDRVNAAARAAARERHRVYWDRRRKAANDWLAATPETEVPALPAGYPANNAIDHFLAARLAVVAAQSAEAKKGSVDYFKQVQPLLEARCYDCHAGAKVKGGLRLDDRAVALKGGRGDGLAIVPGKPEKSALLSRVRAHEPSERMPPKGDRLTPEQVRTLETWVREGASWPDVRAGRTTPTPLADDLTFLRRVTLDTVGVVPSLDEIAAFQRDRDRAKLIDRLLADERWADQWMGYWQDVLAENPNIVNPTLNNTGPFRWWLYESLRDNKPMDLFVTELLRMKGSVRFGGPAGFGVASQNDAPMAAKAMIVSGAFLGVEMKCARCHDAPAHQSTQRELFSLAAMLGGKAIKLPATSTVPLDKIHQGGRKPLISVTLKPGTGVEPGWPFAFVSEARGKELAEHPDDPRDRLAALLTAPDNERFAQVVANRVWKRLMGRGLVEPVEDWEKGRPTHPELLRWLGRELVRSGYDVKHLARLVLNSHAYQRATDPTLPESDTLYAAPGPRRLMAEQVVDSLFAAAGKPFRLEEVSLDIDGQRDLGNSITLGKPRRSWMLTSTSNERDRPSLALPRIQAVTDVLTAFGWRGSRQEPTSVRVTSPNVLQPAILSNGTVGVWLTRLSDDHAVTRLALTEQPAEKLLDTLFLRLLTRRPTPAERDTYLDYLKPGYDRRVRPAPVAEKAKRRPEPYVSWSNHLDAEATLVRGRQEEAARKGDPPTGRLDPAWRARLEDVLWALVNSPEFVFAP
jgi:mono/diheme cytochrome c family protein